MIDSSRKSSLSSARQRGAWLHLARLAQNVYLLRDANSKLRGSSAARFVGTIEYGNALWGKDLSKF